MTWTKPTAEQAASATAGSNEKRRWFALQLFPDIFPLDHPAPQVDDPIHPASLSQQVFPKPFAEFIKIRVLDQPVMVH